MVEGVAFSGRFYSSMGASPSPSNLIYLPVEALVVAGIAFIATLGTCESS